MTKLFCDLFILTTIKYKDIWIKLALGFSDQVKFLLAYTGGSSIECDTPVFVKQEIGGTWLTENSPVSLSRYWLRILTRTTKARLFLTGSFPQNNEVDQQKCEKTHLFVF